MTPPEPGPMLKPWGEADPSPTMKLVQHFSDLPDECE
jgi:hypothetical protein